MELTGPNCNAHDDRVWPNRHRYDPQPPRTTAGQLEQNRHESTPPESVPEFVATALLNDPSHTQEDRAAALIRSSLADHYQ
jgi:hypothetical protein